MYHNLSGHPATRAFGQVDVGLRLILQGSRPEALLTVDDSRSRTEASEWAPNANHAVFWGPAMFTDTGRQVSLQLGTGFDAFPVARGVLKPCHLRQGHCDGPGHRC